MVCYAILMSVKLSDFDSSQKIIFFPVNIIMGLLCRDTWRMVDGEEHILTIDISSKVSSLHRK